MRATRRVPLAAQGVPVALKVIDWRQLEQSEMLTSRLVNEIQIMRKIRSPHVVQLFDVFVQAGVMNSHLVIAMELVDGEDLLQKIRHAQPVCRLDEDLARSLFVQLLAATEYLHENNLVHRCARYRWCCQRLPTMTCAYESSLLSLRRRDIKPENIMVEYGSNHLKLIDFGLSKHITSAKTLGVGTPGFLPPETILRTAPDGRLVAPDAPYDPRKARGEGPAHDVG